MNPRVDLISLGAMLLIGPAAAFAADSFHTGQFTPANGYTPNVTLLTGPTLLSPAPKISPPPISATSVSTIVPGQRLDPPAGANEKSPAWPKLDAGKPVRLPADPTRFDARLQDLPTSLLRKPTSSPPGEMYFKPAAPRRD